MNPRPVFQLRVNLSDAQKAALRALYGDDGETRKIEPRSPAELREILAKSHGHPPVVVLNHHPLPADAMLHGLAQFVAFEDPASERPCRIRNISVEFEDLQSAEIRTKVYAASR